MNLKLIPGHQVGPIKFGMSPEEVRHAVNCPHTTFSKTQASRFPTDAFDDEGIHVYYKPPGVCEAVEVAKPSQVILGGNELVGMPFNQVQEWMQTHGHDLEFDDSGATSKALGIGLYAPDYGKSTSSPIESVLLFAPGYLD